jgi:hypothetical protein
LTGLTADGGDAALLAVGGHELGHSTAENRALPPGRAKEENASGQAVDLGNSSPDVEKGKIQRCNDCHKEVVMRFMLLLVLISSHALAAEYKYVNYSAPDAYGEGRESFTLDVTAKEVISADSIEEVLVCDASSDYYCFHNLSLSFYVPKCELSVGQSWREDGQDFRVLREQRVELFGVEKSVFVISSVRVGRVDYFYYSVTDGLLAIKFVNKEAIQFFVTTGTAGFPMKAADAPAG